MLVPLQTQARTTQFMHFGSPSTGYHGSDSSSHVDGIAAAMAEQTESHGSELQAALCLCRLLSTSFSKLYCFPWVPILPSFAPYSSWVA